MKRRLLIPILFWLVSFTAAAQVDTVNAINGKLQIQQLKQGLRTYLVYSTDTLLQDRTVGDIWQRDTKLITYKGKSAIEFT